MGSLFSSFEEESRSFYGSKRDAEVNGWLTVKEHMYNRIGTYIFSLIHGIHENLSVVEDR